MTWLLIHLVLLYRATLGRLVGGHCRYYPSCSQYAIDVESWGYRDGRLAPEGKMTREDIALWERRRQEDQEGEEIAEEDSED